MISTCEWFSVNLGDALISQSILSEYQCHLTKVYEQAGSPECLVAVFRHESQDLHCHTKLFLTSEFQQLAMLDGAVRCAKPSFDNSSYLAGNPNYMANK
ncbi:hypothetical protein CGG85_23365 [Vibrio parahaemolyticus]|nr:hypothetical protein CGG85_23365 [Vibrio parahaemolyticus]